MVTGWDETTQQKMIPVQSSLGKFNTILQEYNLILKDNS